MPSLKVSVNTEAKSAFSSYEGPEVPAADGYEGVIKNVRVKVGRDSGEPYLNVLVEHDSKDPIKKQYNGAPQWIRVGFGEHDETQARLAAFVKAITGKANKEANIVDTDVDARKGTGSLVKTIDGVKPDGKRVKFDVRARAAHNGYPASTEGDFIRRIIDAPAAAEAEEAEDEVTEEDLDVETEETEDEQTREERESELKKEALADLRAAATEAGIDIKGMKKADLIEAILDWEFEDTEEEAEEEEVDEEEEEVEADEEEEVEEEEEVDPEAEIRAELAGLDRTALKARLKEADAEAKVLKKDTDDDLRDKIVAAELGEPPF